MNATLRTTIIPCARRRARLVRRLAAARARLRVEVDRVRLEDERRVVWRALQEGLGTTLAAISWRAGALMGRAPTERQRAELARLVDLASAGIDDLRAVVWASDADERRWSEIAGYLRSRCNELAASGRRVIVADDSAVAADPVLSGPRAAELVRAVLDAVRVALERSPEDTVTVRVGCDGAPCAVIEAGATRVRVPALAADG